MTSVTEDNLSSDLIYDLKHLIFASIRTLKIKKKNEAGRFQN